MSYSKSFFSRLQCSLTFAVLWELRDLHRNGMTSKTPETSPSLHGPIRRQRELVGYPWLLFNQLCKREINDEMQCWWNDLASNLNIEYKNLCLCSFTLCQKSINIDTCSSVRTNISSGKWERGRDRWKRVHFAKTLSCNHCFLWQERWARISMKCWSL